MDELALLSHFSPYVGIFLLLILGTLGFPFPEDGILLLSGCLIAQDVVKPLPAILVLYPGLLLTDFSLYWLGRRCGRKVIEHKRFHGLVPQERVIKLEEKFGKWGGWVILFGRQVLGLRTDIFLLAGMMKMPGMRFLAVDAVSALLTLFLWVGVGYLGGNSVQTLRKDLVSIKHLAQFLVAALMMIGLIFLYFKTRRDRGGPSTFSHSSKGHGYP